jgi:hypothetical protein
MPTQFPYPGVPWSQGSMRKAKMDPRHVIDESQGIRTLEGERKRREVEVSQAEPEITPERRQQLQYEIEAGQQSKIDPHEIPHFLELYNTWKSLSPDIQSNIRKKHIKDQEMFQMSPKQLREEGVQPQEAEPDRDQYGQQSWQGFMRGKMKQ